MKRVIITATVFALLGFVTFSLMHQHFTGLWPWDEVERDGNLVRINSAILNEDREMIIHLPAGYDSLAEETYPVIYVLDGGVFDVRMAESVSVISAAGFGPQAIVVGVPNMGDEKRKRDYTPPYLRQDVDDVNSPMGAADNFLNFLEKELLPFIENQYRTNGHRVLTGHSRGGLLVMYSLEKSPLLFDARFSFSAPYWREDALMVRHIQEFFDQQDSVKTMLYMSVGAHETENMKSGFENMRAAFSAKTPSGFVLKTSVTTNADHQTNGSQSIPDALGWWIGEIER
jgi:predicted alpha/beta superfamily hydrolase